MRSESCSFIWHPKVRTKYVRATGARLGAARRAGSGVAGAAVGRAGFAAAISTVMPSRRPVAQAVGREADVGVVGQLPDVTVQVGDVPRCRQMGGGPAQVPSPRVMRLAGQGCGHRRLRAGYSSEIGSSSAAVNSASDGLAPMPACWRTRSEISTMISGFSARKVLAFSRPWPSCSPS